MEKCVMIGVASGILLAFGCSGISDANDDNRVTAVPLDDIDWTVLPDGRAIATVHGDRQTGEHTTYVRFPAGLKTAVHTHSNSYHGIVIQGSARHYEPASENSAQWLTAGSVYRVPANTPHISECSAESACIFAIHQHDVFDRSVIE